MKPHAPQVGELLSFSTLTGLLKTWAGLDEADSATSVSANGECDATISRRRRPGAPGEAHHGLQQPDKLFLSGLP